MAAFRTMDNPDGSVVQPPPQQGPAPAPANTGIGFKIFMALVILGFAAAGYGGIKTYLEKSDQSRRLQEDGVEADADVMSVTEISGRRIETYHELSVSYDPSSEDFLAFAEVKDCSGARYESGISTVRVVYLPDDPEVIRLAACEANFDTDRFPGIIGLVFGALALLLLWRLGLRFWTS
jgi:hypothetical protein